MGFAAVQRVGKAANAASLAISSGDGWSAPASGNLIVVTANSDATVTISGTYTAGPSVVDGNGTYTWYKISDGSETTITLTPSVSDTICGTVCEYSGAAASPFDASNSSTIAGSSGTTTTSTSVTTTADGDLVIVAALTHLVTGGVAPSAASWTNSFTNQLSPGTGGTGPADVYTFFGELVAGVAGSYSTSASWTGSMNDRQQLMIAFKAAPTSIPYSPPRTALTRDPGEVWWIQRDRRDALTVATAANPLPSPLDSAWQAGGGYWHLYNDSADAAPRTWQSLQRQYASDPSLLSPAAGPPPPPSPQRTVQARDPGEVPWQQPARRDPLLLTSAELENELLGGAGTQQRYQTAAGNGPRWWAPQQPKRDGYTPGLLDSALLENGLLGGADAARHYLAAAYCDRREVPAQRAYISDPSFYPTVAPTDPLTVTWGAGGTYWWLYNTAAAQIDRREVPQQRRYVSDPGLLLAALLENELLGSADDLRRRQLAAAYLRPAPLPGRPAFAAPGPPDADPLTLTGNAWRALTAAAYADRRQTTVQPPRWTLYFDAGPGTPPLTLAYGAGGSLWHRYNPRWPARSWWPPRPVFVAAGLVVCETPRPFNGVTAQPNSGTTARPDTGITEPPCGS